MNTLDTVAEHHQDANQDTGSSHELPQLKQESALNADKLAAIAARLDALPTRQQVTLAAAIQTLAPTVKKLRARGYSVDEVAAAITANGLKVSGRTLARMLATGQPAKRRASSHG